MTITINTDFADGGSNLGKSHGGEPTVADALRAAADDLAELRAQFVLLLAKLDAEDVVDMDVDYASTLTPDAMTLVKG
jgi:hypothetical protein